MELKIPSSFKTRLDRNSALSGLVHTSIHEFGEWLKQNNVKFFTEYTDHSLEHVENVLETANNLIRDECRTYLTEHDIATLILAALLHDCAMHVSEDGFINLVKENHNTIVKGFDDKPWSLLWSDFLAEARRFSGRKLIALFGDTDPIRHPPLDNPQQLTGKDLLLCGEFLRRHHSRLAHEIALFGVPGPFGRDLKLPITDDTSHVVDLAGVIARSHGLNIRDCFNYLQRYYSSMKEVRGIHPTFLMALLRVSDILQIQSKRAPKQVLKVRQLKSPVSLGEWEMHQAIKDISSKEYPETIWVVAKPENVKTYLRIRNLLDQIQSELDSSWTVIGEFYGYDPEFREFGLKIRRVRSNIDDLDSFSKQVLYIPVHAAFEVADTDLLKLLIGPLYGEKAEIGIRELMQNAVDAVNEFHEYRKRFIDLSLEAPSQDGDIVISMDQDENEEWWLTVSDIGIGMTINTVKEYFLKAGASLRRSEIWKKTFEDEDGKSKVLRSGRFGIGALAAFLVGDQIKVSTRHASSMKEDGVEFVAQIDTEAIEIKNMSRPIGTTVRIKMNKQAIEALIPLPNETKWLLREKSQKWDWYCLADPLVVRKTNQTNLVQASLVPKQNSELPHGWRRIKHPDFEDVHWSYVPYLPSLICNGIEVRVAGSNEWNQIQVQDKYIGFSKPRLSIFDFNANLPLNIQRTNITVSNLPFHQELLESVIRDYITFILVEAPDKKFPLEIVGQKSLVPDYYGIVGETIPNSRFSFPQLIATNSGTGIFCDPMLFNELGNKSALAIFSYANDETVSKINLPSCENIMNISFDYETGSRLDDLNQAIEFGLGLRVSNFGEDDDLYAIKLKPYGNNLVSARLLISKQIIDRLANYREYSSLGTDILRDINNINLPIFEKFPSP